MARLDEVLAGTEPWSKWWLDQLAHACLGTAYALLPSFMILYLTAWGVPVALIAGASLALFGGATREVVDAIQTGKMHPLDRSVDALFHLLGAPVAVGIVLLTRLLH